MLQQKMLNIEKRTPYKHSITKYQDKDTVVIAGDLNAQIRKESMRAL